MQQAETLLKEDLSVGKQDGKHLIFELAKRGYGIPILKVNEIIGIIDITPIPKSPAFIKGIINLRGKIIPIMDLRLKFGMPEKEYDKQTCIIIVNVSFGGIINQIGLIVDIVSEVFDIPVSEIEAPPKYGSDKEEFLNGVGKVKGSVIMLLNIEKAIYSEDIIRLLSK